MQVDEVFKGLVESIYCLEVSIFPLFSAAGLEGCLLLALTLSVPSVENYQFRTVIKEDKIICVYVSGNRLGNKIGHTQCLSEYG